MEKMAKNTGSAIALPVHGKDGHVIQLSIGKENGEFKIKDVKVHDPGAKKKR